MDRPNVLLITTDQQRYDSLSCNDAPVGRTPHLDTMAARGVIFDRCYLQNPVCVPSRASLQTGKYPHQHGVRHMEDRVDATPGLAESELTVHERLREAGYHTAAFGKIHMMPDRGFDTMQVTGGKGARWTQSTGLPIGPGPLGPQYAAWLESRNPGSYERIYQERRRPEYRQFGTALPFPLPASEHVDSWIGGNVVEFLSNPPAEPWFVWCGFTGPHGPLDVPPEYLDRYSPDDMPEPLDWTIDLRDRWPYRKRSPRAGTEAEMANARRWTAYYHALLDLIDDQVGQIIQCMDRRGLWDNTLVLFTSDHGEMRGDFGLYGKGSFLEPISRLPAFIVPPGSREGRRFAGLVEMFDFAPTILDYAGVAIPEGMSARSLRGEIETGAGGRDCVFGEHVDNSRQWGGVYCRTDTHKLVLWSSDDDGGGELYCLEEDPLERVNRYADPALRAVRDELQARIIARGVTARG